MPASAFSTASVDWTGVRYVRIEDDNRYVTTINKLQLGDMRIMGSVPVSNSSYIGHVHMTAPAGASYTHYVYDEESVTNNRGMSDAMAPGDPNALHVEARDMWLSAAGAVGADPAIPLTFDLGASYDLGQMVIWNANWTTVNNRGVKHVLIETSNDGGATYTPLDDTNGNELRNGNYTIPMTPVDGEGLAMGPSSYDYAPILTGITADHVKMTVLSNWGGAGFYVVSEVRFYTDVVVAVPEPSTFALLAGLSLLGLGYLRRR